MEVIEASEETEVQQDMKGYELYPKTPKTETYVGQKEESIQSCAGLSVMD